MIVGNLFRVNALETASARCDPNDIWFANLITRGKPKINAAVPVVLWRTKRPAGHDVMCGKCSRANIL